MKSFKTEILGLYRKVNELFAAGDLTMLKRNATGPLLLGVALVSRCCADGI